MAYNSQVAKLLRLRSQIAAEVRVRDGDESLRPPPSFVTSIGRGAAASCLSCTAEHAENAEKI
jgi:hypothetical protein